MYQTSDLEVLFVPSELQDNDMLTKAVSYSKLEERCEIISMIDQNIFEEMKLTVK